jgi:ubiquinol-cytochrome c reductase cytochrome b subunit
LTAFLGYVLPWGAMSFWGATVITNLLSAIPWIGKDMVEFIWGGFSVDNATLNRFFSLHYLLPFILAALAVLHTIALHEHGSNNPLGITANTDRIPFHPYYSFKDFVGFFIFFLIVSIFIFYAPNYLGHPDNFTPANPLVTPPSIVPEWYLLPFYTILRSIPDKLGGVIAMFSAMLILLLLPILDVSRVRSNAFKPINKFFFWLFVANFFLLGWIGGNHAEEPFITIGQICTTFYFSYFLIIVPMIGILENTLMDIATTRVSQSDQPNSPPHKPVTLLL